MLTPTPTATPDDNGLVGIPGDPYTSAPICPDDLSVNPELHKQQKKAHGLWDAERGCRYTHTHNAAGNYDYSFNGSYVFKADELNSIFGDYTFFTGSEVSYPWETPSENQNKHPAYKWMTLVDVPCDSTSVRVEGVCVTP